MAARITSRSAHHFGRLSLLANVQPWNPKNVLGNGSYAQVFVVDYCGTPCAAKQIHDLLIENSTPQVLDKMVREFENECQIWANLRHPNIVQFIGVYFSHPTDRLPIIVMEMMSTNLWNYLEKHSKDEFSFPQKMYVIQQVAQGMVYLHEQRPPLVHRDLKPNNILLCEESFSVKLTDFGMTRVLDNPSMPRLSSVKGNPIATFTAPEALQIPPIYEEKADIFSFGNCILMTLSHECPVPVLPTAEVYGRIVGLSEYDRRKQHIESFLASREGYFWLSNDLVSLLQSCLQNSPHNRPSSHEVLAFLKRIMPDCKKGLQKREDLLRSNKIVEAEIESLRKNVDTTREEWEILRQLYCHKHSELISLRANHSK